MMFRKLSHTLKAELTNIRQDISWRIYLSLAKTNISTQTRLKCFGNVKNEQKVHYHTFHGKNVQHLQQTYIASYSATAKY